MLVVSQQDNSSVEQLTIISENGDIANCLRARASLNATDNTIVEHEKDSFTIKPDAGRKL